MSLPAHILPEKEAETRRSEDVQGEHLRREAAVDVERFAETIHAGVVDQHVDPDVPFAACLIKPVGGICRRQIHRNRTYFHAVLPGQSVGGFAQRRLFVADDDQRIAARSQFFGVAVSDAGTGSGNQCPHAFHV